MIYPHEPPGNSAFSSWAKRLVRCLRQLELKPAPGYRINQTADGTRLEILAGMGRPESNWYPFKVYVSGGNPSVEASDWRTFRVRAGAVFFDSATPTNVVGTDGTDSDPDNAEATTGTDRFTVSASLVDYYVWLEMDHLGTAWAAHVTHGENPAVTGWFNWPNFDGHHVLIAHIDTNTSVASKTAIIRQYQRTDIQFGPLMAVCLNGEMIQAAIMAAYKEPVPLTADITYKTADDTTITADRE